MVDAFCDREGDVVWVKLEGVVMTIGKKGSAHKAWANVVEMDVMDASDVAKLGEAFHIMVDVTFGGGIGRGSTQSSCASDAADDSEVGFLFWMLHEVVEGGIDQLCESYHIGGHGRHLLVDVEGWILVADAGAMEI